MADIAIVGALLRHINPSMAVSGRRSGLPAGDRVGTLLNHVSPSMAARLARNAAGRPHGPAGAQVGPPSQAAILRAKQANLKTAAVHGPPVAPAADGDCGFRAQPIRECGWIFSCKGFDRPVDAFAADGAGGSEPADADKLHWPWEGPLPPVTTPPACIRVYVRAAAPALGELIDVFA